LRFSGRETTASCGKLSMRGTLIPVRCKRLFERPFILKHNLLFAYQEREARQNDSIFCRGTKPHSPDKSPRGAPLRQVLRWFVVFKRAMSRELRIIRRICGRSTNLVGLSGVVIARKQLE